jgi:hypothetical protein
MDHTDSPCLETERCDTSEADSRGIGCTNLTSPKLGTLFESNNRAWLNCCHHTTPHMCCHGEQSMKITDSQTVLLIQQESVEARKRKPKRDAIRNQHVRCKLKCRRSEARKRDMCLSGHVVRTKWRYDSSATSPSIGSPVAVPPSLSLSLLTANQEDLLKRAMEALSPAS